MPVEGDHPLGSQGGRVRPASAEEESKVFCPASQLVETMPDQTLVSRTVSLLLPLPNEGLILTRGDDMDVFAFPVSIHALNLECQDDIFHEAVSKEELLSFHSSSPSILFTFLAAAMDAIQVYNQRQEHLECEENGLYQNSNVAVQILVLISMLGCEWELIC